MTELDRVRRRLEELGRPAKKSLGQNFLVSETVIKRILRRVEDSEAAKHQVIEIGPGLGALTDRLKLSDEARLELIELDQTLAEYWQAQGYSVTEGDALRVDWEAMVQKGPALILSNLPYQISSSLVIDRSLGPESITEMVLMFQKEVAQRVVALPKTSNYGLLSVVAQVFWDIEKVCEAGPRDFFPSPKVASRVLHFTRRDPGLKVSQGKGFLSFVKKAFSQRRRKLSKNLLSYFGKKAEQESFLEWLQSSGLTTNVRAEELSPGQFLELFKLLKENHGY